MSNNNNIQFVPGKNFALKKPVKQSSTYDYGFAGFAVDGSANTTGLYRLFISTQYLNYRYFVHVSKR